MTGGTGGNGRLTREELDRVVEHCSRQDFRPVRGLIYKLVDGVECWILRPVLGNPEESR